MEIQVKMFLMFLCKVQVQHILKHPQKFEISFSSVADTDPGSSAILTPGPGSIIGKSSIILCKLNNFQFCDICGYKKRYRAPNFFPSSLLLLFLDPGSGIDKNQDPGSGINIPDFQHCHLAIMTWK